MHTDLFTKLLATALLSLTTCLLFSQANFWSDVSESSFAHKNAIRHIQPDKYRTLSLDFQALKTALAAAPLRFTEAANQSQPTLTLPMPDGSFQDFQVMEAPVMEPALAAKYLKMRTYAGWSRIDPTAYLRCGVTQKGFVAVIFSAKHSPVFIDPFAEGDSKHHISYFKKDYKNPHAHEFTCQTKHPINHQSSTINHQSPESLVGDCKLRTYSLALACTGEYAAFHGGTKPLVMAEYVESMVRLNGIYERELACTFVLVANTDLLIYLNPATDPYTNNDGSTMLDENQEECDNVIGSTNYDIGHVFSTGGGGVAFLNAVCNPGIKAGGVTGLTNPTGDPFWVDYVAHEMGHQFGGSHTQNNDCNRSNATAMETGSGVTIMGYAGICDPNVASNSIDNYHAISLDEIAGHLVFGGGNTCATSIVTGNNAPSLSVVQTSYNIPKSTPFFLTATGTDPDGDALTYNWEQMNNEVSTQPPLATNPNGPSFRCLPSTPSPTRYFPNLTAILSNSTPTWEVLPSVGRTMNFRCTVRDNRPLAGCTDEVDVVLNVSNSAGPFVVTAPNTSAVTWGAGSSQTVTWNVASTNVNPVNATQVEIFLSIDGGQTYPYTLSSGTANDGTQSITVPDNIPNTVTTARVMVKGKSNVFFDVSNQNFTITSPPSFAFGASVAPISVCNNAQAVFTVNLASISGFSQSVSLSATGAPGSATVSFNPTAISPPGNAQMTVGNLSGVAAGTYSLIITATSGVIVKTTTAELTLFENLTSQVALSTPADGVSGLSGNPVLSWQTMPGASSYVVEMSANPDFSTILETGTVDTTHYQTTSILPLGDVVYWRVRAGNPCNNSPNSVPFAFQLRNDQCNTYAATGLPLIIPSNAATTVSKTLTVPGSFTVSKLTTHLNINHTWIGDVGATLAAPDGTSITLFDRPGVAGAGGFGCDRDNISASFFDAAANSAAVFESTCGAASPAISGDFQPVNPMSNFTGKTGNGGWTLTVSDAFQEDGGEVTAWSLEFCSTTFPVAANLLTNSPLLVPQAQAELFTAAHLQADTLQGTATFTLLSLPTHGTLTLLGSALDIGDSFLQSDIDNGYLSYQHGGGAELADEFQFDLLTANLNWLHDQTFQISILQNNLAASSAISQTISCNEASDGAVTATPSGGTAPFSYSLNGGTFQASPVFSNLTAGTYTIEVKDANGFTDTTNAVTLSDPPALSVATSVTDDDLTVSASGGTGAFTYSLEGVGTQASNEFPDLPNGVYNVVVEDANGCTAEATTVVAVNTLIVGAAITQNIGCFGNSTGVVTVSVGGGQPPYAFSLNGGASQNEPVFSSLPAGTYSVQVVDQAGFTQTTNQVTLNNPPQITATATVTGYSVTVVASGGTGAFIYNLDGGSFQSNNVFFPVPGGFHTFIVRDANGCTQVVPVNVSVASLTVAATATAAISCFGGNDGEITATAGGGVAPYQFSLNGGAFTSNPVFANLPAGNYTILTMDSGGFSVSSSTVTLAAPTQVTAAVAVVGYDLVATAGGGTPGYTFSLDGGAAQPSNVFENVPNGNHQIVMTDANGCTASASVSVNIAPLQVVATIDQQVSCHDASDASITVQATGGIAPLLFRLNGGAWQSGNTFSNLPAGNYVVEVQDAGGLVIAAPALVIDNPVLLEASASAFGNTVTVVASGGTGSLEYSLDGGAFQSGNLFTGVANGAHEVQVQDENGCKATATAEVNAILNASLSVKNITCPGDSDGEIAVTDVTGGVPPNEYSLDGGAWQTASIFTGLSGGIYQVAIRDATGFTWETDATVSEPSVIDFVVQINGDSIVVLPAVGTGYSLDGGVTFQTSNIFPDLPNGTYPLVVRYGNDCLQELDAVTIFNTGAGEAGGNFPFEVSPNPSSGRFVLKMGLPTAAQVRLAVFDLAGRLVFSEKLNGGGQFSHVLDLSELASGVYQLQVIASEKWGVKRLIVH